MKGTRRKAWIRCPNCKQPWNIDHLYQRYPKEMGQPEPGVCTCGAKLDCSKSEALAIKINNVHAKEKDIKKLPWIVKKKKVDYPSISKR